MTPVEIVEADAVKRKVNGQKVLENMQYLIDHDAAVLLHKNKSVLFLRALPDADIEMHLFTEDNPFGLTKSLKYFLEQIKLSFFRTMYGEADNEQIIALMKIIGMDIQPSNKPEYNWMWKIER